MKKKKDLGVVFNNSFKAAVQCSRSARTANGILGMISRTFHCKKRKIILRLYKSLVRPHMDYCIQAWRPHLKKDIEILKKVQRRATRMVEEYKGKDYSTRLEILNLTTL